MEIIKTKSGLCIPCINPKKLTTTKIGIELQDQCCILYFPRCTPFNKYNLPHIYCKGCLYDVDTNALEFIKFAEENWC